MQRADSSEKTLMLGEWRQEEKEMIEDEKEMTEDEMVRWHHRLNGYESE